MPRNNIFENNHEAAHPFGPLWGAPWASSWLRTAHPWSHHSASAAARTRCPPLPSAPPYRPPPALLRPLPSRSGRAPGPGE
eukprot:5600775-Pyramimonas_sp.AAC.1